MGRPSPVHLSSVLLTYSPSSHLLSGSDGATGVLRLDCDRRLSPTTVRTANRDTGRTDLTDEWVTDQGWTEPERSGRRRGNTRTLPTTVPLGRVS